MIYPNPVSTTDRIGAVFGTLVAWLPRGGSSTRFGTIVTTEDAGASRVALQHTTVHTF
jgi:hypothetical protein